MAERELRERVRERYAEAARSDMGSCGCGCGPEPEAEVFGGTLYSDEERAALPSAIDASLGCGNPTAVAELHPGEVVLDLGSGAGGDALLSAGRVGPEGKVYGLDMTAEMLALARRNAADAGVANVEFLEGVIEDVPLPDASVDVVISNCVVNLSTDKPRVFREAARVLRPGGRLAIADVVADEEMDESTRADVAAWTGCIAGALTRRELAALEATGFAAVEVAETHRVHERAGSAIVRARKPMPIACSLSDADLRLRGAELRGIFESAAVERLPDGVRLRLEDAEGRAGQVHELVRKERECCPSLRFEVTESAGQITVDVTAPEQGEELLEAFGSLVG